jgi:hypothetical protein
MTIKNDSKMPPQTQQMNPNGTPKVDAESPQQVAARTGLEPSQQNNAQTGATAPAAVGGPAGQADQAAADKAAADAKVNETAANAGGAGGSMRTGAAPGTLAAGQNNPSDGEPIAVPTGDLTRPDATKGPLHNPGVVVEPGMDDPSPTTAVAPGTVLGAAGPGSMQRDPTEPSRKH